MIEYTQEEINQNGNQMYGGKRHDLICDELEKSGYTEKEINLVSIGIWKGIESERLIKQKEIDELRLEYDKLTDWASEYKAENAKLRECVEFYSNETSWDDFDGNCLCHIITSNDVEHIIGDTLIGGKRARQCLKELTTN